MKLNIENLKKCKSVKDVESLVKENEENEILDYKEKFPKDKKEEFLKDVICLINSLEYGDRYLIYGVDDKGKFKGLDEVPKEEDINNYLSDKENKSKYLINRIINIEIKTLKISERYLLIIRIFDEPDQVPCYMKKNHSCQSKIDKKNKKIIPYAVYSRKGSSNIGEPVGEEMLVKIWKRRFGLDLTLHEMFLKSLDNLERWDLSYKNHPLDSIPEINRYYFFDGKNYFSIIKTNSTTSIGFEEIDYDYANKVWNLKNEIEEPDMVYPYISREEYILEVNNCMIEKMYFFRHKIKNEVIPDLMKNQIDDFENSLQKKIFYLILLKNGKDEKYINSHLSLIKNK